MSIVENGDEDGKVHMAREWHACDGSTPECRLTTMFGFKGPKSDGLIDWCAEDERLNREMGLPAGAVALTWCERHSCRIVRVRSISFRLPDGSIVRK